MFNYLFYKILLINTTHLKYNAIYSQLDKFNLKYLNDIGNENRIHNFVIFLVFTEE